MADLSPRQVEELGAEITTPGLKAVGAMKPSEFMKHLADQGFNNDEIEATFIKNFGDRKSTRLNSSHVSESRMPSSA